MKYLKRFESQDEEEYRDSYGITPEDIKFLFIELEDEGWVVYSRFTSKLHQWDFNSEFDDKNLKLGLTPHIEVRIKDSNPSGKSSATINRNLFELMRSDNFREIVEVANSRVNESGWKINSIKVELDYIIISLSKTNI